MSVEDSLCRLQVLKSLDEAQIQKLNGDIEQVLYAHFRIFECIVTKIYRRNRLGKRAPIF